MGAEERLVACLAPILHDLAEAGVPAPEIRGEPWLLGPDGPTAAVYVADGSGRGVRLSPQIPFADQVAMLADQVQQWVCTVPGTSAEPIVWPGCPEHPGTHPLRTDVTHGSLSASGVGLDNSTGRAVWRCPLSGRLVCAIGKLPSAETR